jgi:Protein phosphatase 2C
MNADSAFIIGATHAVCQDYAVAGNGSRPYLILSDGCSSSPDTDIGARLLVKAAEQFFLGPSKPAANELPEMHKESAHRALIWAELASLPPQAVDATLLTAHLRGDELIFGCSGDGAIVLQSWTGAVDVYAISYPSGYPLYPGYSHQPERLQTLTGGDGRVGKEVRRYRSASLAEPLQLEETTTSVSLTEVFTVKASDYKHAVVLSDGIQSFFTTRQTETSKSVEDIPMEEILNGLLSFKSVHGAFVGRRLKSFLKGCQARGWRHRDDLAIGALHLGD